MFAMSINKNFKKYWVGIIEVFLKMRKLKKRKNADTKKKKYARPRQRKKKRIYAKLLLQKKKFLQSCN